VKENATIRKILSDKPTEPKKAHLQVCF